MSSELTPRQLFLARIAMQAQDIQMHRTLCCVNCESFDEPRCMRFKVNPPSLVVASGCEFWQADLPF